jgi:hypothetical protein
MPPWCTKHVQRHQDEAKDLALDLVGPLGQTTGIVVLFGGHARVVMNEMITTSDGTTPRLTSSTTRGNVADTIYVIKREKLTSSV